MAKKRGLIVVRKKKVKRKRKPSKKVVNTRYRKKTKNKRKPKKKKIRKKKIMKKKSGGKDCDNKEINFLTTNNNKYVFGKNTFKNIPKNNVYCLSCFFDKNPTDLDILDPKLKILELPRNFCGKTLFCMKCRNNDIITKSNFNKNLESKIINLVSNTYISDGQLQLLDNIVKETIVEKPKVKEAEKAAAEKEAEAAKAAEAAAAVLEKAKAEEAAAEAAEEEKKAAAEIKAAEAAREKAEEEVAKAAAIKRAAAEKEKAEAAKIVENEQREITKFLTDNNIKSLMSNKKLQDNDYNEFLTKLNKLVEDKQGKGIVQTGIDIYNFRRDEKNSRILIIMGDKDPILRDQFEKLILKRF